MLIHGRAAAGVAAALATVVSLAIAPGALAGAPPIGATARCTDGTYSYSQSHSGSCSHHGGVAKWLDGSGNASSTQPTRSAGPTGAGSSAGVAVGRTILLAPRLKTSRCKLGPSPDGACSPGAFYSRLTGAVICSPTFRTSAIRDVPESEKFAVEREYGLAPGHYGRTLEIDHIVSLELGGSNDIANLYPERANAHPGYQVKDRLENRLHDMVCDGSLTLRAAQRGIASNWQSLYLKVFGGKPIA